MGAGNADTGGKCPAAAGRGCGVPFPFAAHKANGTAVFTRCSSFPLKILLKWVFLPADSAAFPLSLKIQMKRAVLPAVPCITINPAGRCSARCAGLSEKFSLISWSSGGRGNGSANRMKISPYSLQTMKKGK